MQINFHDLCFITIYIYYLAMIDKQFRPTILAEAFFSFCINLQVAITLWTNQRKHLNHEFSLSFH